MMGDLFNRISEIGAVLLPRTEVLPLITICQDLSQGDGEATGLARAREVLARYAELGDEEKKAFFTELATHFGPDQERFSKAIEAWKANPEDETKIRDLHFASEPRSQELIRRLNRAPGGTASLVAMREDLLRFAKKDPALGNLDQDFRHLLSSWFNRGFLQIEAIDWSTPAMILEKIIQYEAVHEITGWDDLRRRVAAPDRRLYAFFHPSLPGEPLIFVEVALTAEMPDAIGPILAEERKFVEDATVATFYSISNCQVGLRGVSFGAFLIKQVVETLQAELPQLKTFVTLSPVPGLSNWARGADVALEGEKLPEHAAHYLAEEKSPRGGPLDPVARFHLGNGARLERILPNADLGARGQKASAGVMVNYLYDLAQIERNHEAFASAGTIAVSNQVKKLLNKR